MGRGRGLDEVISHNSDGLLQGILSLRPSPALVIAGPLSPSLESSPSAGSGGSPSSLLLRRKTVIGAKPWGHLPSLHLTCMPTPSLLQGYGGGGFLAVLFFP